jgi:hypothetical protein
MLLANAWRASFVVGAVLLMAGGPQHPKGSMVQMLHDPKWVPAHALMLGGFLALWVGLFLCRKAAPAASGTTKWLKIAAVATGLQAVEMALHTAAAVDYGNLVAGQSTPVLTTHLALAVVAYPVFAASVIGLILAGVRERSLGSPWIAWIGIIGAIGHGAAAPLVILTDIAWARLLFPLLMLLAIWLILAAFWPVRVRSTMAAETAA